MLIVTIILKVYHHGSFKTDCLTNLIDSVEKRIMKDRKDVEKESWIEILKVVPHVLHYGKHNV